MPLLRTLCLVGTAATAEEEDTTCVSVAIVQQLLHDNISHNLNEKKVSV